MGHIAQLPRIPFYFFTVGMLILGCALFTLMHKEAVASHLHAWKLLPRPERLTELFFTNPIDLPETVSSSNPLTVMFTVHNLEQQTTQYRYAVAAVRSVGKEQVLAEGNITLAHGSSQDIARTFKPPAVGHRVQIQVKLEYDGIPLGHDQPSLQTQTIHYWVNTDNTTVKEGGA